MPIASFSLAAIDCPDPQALCRFYQGIVGGEIEFDPRDEDWVRLQVPGGSDLGFQRVAGHRPPGWPDGDPPQQLHLDFDVDDLDTGEQQVLALGAHKAEVQPEPSSWLVFLDPAGHPFCLVRSSSTSP